MSSCKSEYDIFCNNMNINFPSPYEYTAIYLDTVDMVQIDSNNNSNDLLYQQLYKGRKLFVCVCFVLKNTTYIHMVETYIRCTEKMVYGSMANKRICNRVRSTDYRSNLSFNWCWSCDSQSWVSSLSYALYMAIEHQQLALTNKCILLQLGALSRSWACDTYQK